MKKLTPLILGMLIIFLSALSTSAQEGLETIPSREMREIRPESPSHGSTINETEVDVKAFKPSVREVVRDSVSYQKATPSRKPDKQQSEDVLKFNFLYYIIQRFKFSDIIE